MKKFVLITLLILPITLWAQRSSVSRFYPNGGEIFFSEDTCIIAWDGKLDPGSLYLSLWDGCRSEWTTLPSYIYKPGKPYLKWAIPKGLEGTRFRIKAQDQTDPLKQIMSDSYFSITAKKKANSKNWNPLSKYSKLVKINQSSSQVGLKVDAANHSIKRVKVLNVLGQIVYDGIVEAQKATIETQVLKSGNYFIVTSLSDGSIESDAVIINR